MSTRPTQGAPRSDAFVTRFYRRDLRLVVIGTALLTTIWSLFSGIGFYRNSELYNDNNAPTLATISIVVGSLYMGVFVIGLFGICVAASQKLNLIRIFAFLSALAVLIVVGINLLRIAIHFKMKETILKSCASTAHGQSFVYGGWWGPIYSDTLSFGEAPQFCNRHYDRDSWSLVVGFLLLSGLSIVFSVIAFNYLRQMIDPSTVANSMRGPQRSAAHVANYLPPYGPPSYNSGYGRSFYNYPAPAGPPPGPYSGPLVPEYDGKPPRYTGEGWEDMQKKKHDEDSGPNGERDEVSPKTGDPRD